MSEVEGSESGREVFGKSLDVILFGGGGWGLERGKGRKFNYRIRVTLF